jgi:serine/threonine-protein kinase RsbW
MLEIENTTEALADADASLGLWLEGHEVAPAADMLAHMVLEEIVTNCLKYGYDDDARHVVLVHVTLSDGRLTMQISDDGRPFDPTAAPVPDLDAPLDEREPGGLGLHLLRTMADRVSYERRDGRNVLTVEKAVD